MAGGACPEPDDRSSLIDRPRALLDRVHPDRRWQPEALRGRAATAAAGARGSAREAYPVPSGLGQAGRIAEERST